MGKLHNQIKGEHRKVYESCYGKIPKGFHIHHIDKNPLNNNIENLICITEEDHKNIHKNEYILWANKGGEIGGRKCVNDKLGWFSKTEEELKEIRKQALLIANSLESVEKRSKTYKQRYEEKAFEHWTRKYSNEEVKNKICVGDPGKGMRGKVSGHKGKTLVIKNPQKAIENKKIAALNRKKYPCDKCGKEFDGGNLAKHKKSCNA
jgi:hypothetical protein